MSERGDDRRRGRRRRGTARRLALPGLAVLIVLGGWGAVRLARRHFGDARARRVGDCGELIRHHARANGLDADLVERIVLTESGGDPRAVSKAGAAGLMQIMPATEREILNRTGYADGDLFDPEYNIRLGTAYLRMLLDRFDRQEYLAVAAYHMGPTRLARIRQQHAGLGPEELIRRYAPPATAAYCRKVLGR